MNNIHDYLTKTVEDFHSNYDPNSFFTAVLDKPFINLDIVNKLLNDAPSIKDIKLLAMLNKIADYENTRWEYIRMNDNELLNVYIQSKDNTLFYTLIKLAYKVYDELKQYLKESNNGTNRIL